MKQLITSFIFLALFPMHSCKDSKIENNIKMYTETWDHIINDGNLDLINLLNFTEDITLITSPENVVGIEDFKAYYSNFINGFSDVSFTIIDVFGQGDKIVKHWHYKGTHTGDFFGIPATGKTVDIEGSTIVKMKDGKIAQEQDFMDNLVFMGQLGLDPFLNPDNVITIRTLYDNFAKGDIESVGAVMDENLIWNEAENFPYADGNPYKGFNAVVDGVFSRIMNDWEYWNLSNLEFHEMTNNKVLASGRYEAKHKKNEAVINLQMAHLWTLKNGKIISFQQFADTKGISDAMTQ
ncbi:ester cyclase [Aestuariivivens sp. NBU2969]|uniref:ester cyclase n=1 Tax=Aestuariivivens sp. NBU2969 TaxID=2873267 RepID=UPI001CBCAE2C|nr:ester cyclase [Aestuariivivens sp. NBU2969]